MEFLEVERGQERKKNLTIPRRGEWLAWRGRGSERLSEPREVGRIGWVVELCIVRL